MTTPLLLPEEEVHLWCVSLDQAFDPALLEVFAAILTPDERERWGRFRFEEGRRQFLLSHALLRHVLSYYAPLAPGEWLFRRSVYGKPEIAFGDDHPLAALRSLSFNLTHTRGLAACVVAREREVGVDAEQIDRGGRDVGDHLIRHCLSADEKRALDTLPPEERKRGFFDYWTLKEAYLKARGVGLSLPIDEITFHWPASQPHAGRAAIRFGPAIQDDPALWQFERFVPSGEHRVAVAIRRIGMPDLTVRIFDYPRDALLPI